MIDFILRYIKPIMVVVVFTVLVLFGAVVFDAVSGWFLFIAAWFAIAVVVKSKVSGFTVPAYETEVDTPADVG